MQFKSIVSLFFAMFFCVTMRGYEAGNARIVGLLAIRNEKNIIAQCLKALSLYTDAIVVLDDASTDETVAIVEALAQECKIEKVIKKNLWYRDEAGDRNALLQAGREIGGTHFACFDADEMFTSNCLKDHYLRKTIIDLKPGDVLELNLIALWRSLDQFRLDNSVWANNYRDFVFCDDGKCFYNSQFLHGKRTPGNLKGAVRTLRGYEHGVLHFQFINWQNLLIKQAWYRCLEHIRNPKKSISFINKVYGASKDEHNLGLSPSHKDWFSEYRFFDRSIYGKPEEWRKRQILGWFGEYGRQFFSELDIWDINWDGKDDL